MRAAKASAKHIDVPFEPPQIIADYRLAYRSRQASLIGRREVLSGKAKFGIFGDGKELANIAIGHVFRKGDWRSGYYRDQTWMDMLGVMSLQQLFAQLYAHADLKAEPNTGGRGMNAHFATRYVREDGTWLDQTSLYNSSADVSPTGTQMPRAVGLAYASVLYRKLDSLKAFSQFSHNGDEVTFATIGNASTAEGLFWESLNAIGVLQAPAIITVFDDGYGISVPNQFQMVKENIHDILEGFRRDDCLEPDCLRGYDLLQVRGWDYEALNETYQHAARQARTQHIPVLVHVTELTQPQGHSTSGSHERYKTPERLQWEAEYDCIRKMREWMLKIGVVSEPEIAAFEQQDRDEVEGLRRTAWEAYLRPIQEERAQVMDILDEMAGVSAHAQELKSIREGLAALPAPLRRDLHAAAHAALRLLRDENHPTKPVLASWASEQDEINVRRYGSHLYTG
ncbi:MAG TPA: thiamine pyrophosphate-dependent enzyme, partial [Anaerolineales bacterium]|nr:thiamine pyrophosphate-dependent enzyme [Anaerolineales bacterium]